jgi:hypothetical protein
MDEDEMGEEEDKEEEDGKEEAEWEADGNEFELADTFSF